MIAKFFKTILAALVLILSGAVVSSCSDDEDDAVTNPAISFTDTDINTYQPQGMVKIPLKVTGNTSELKLSSFRFNRFLSSSSGSLDNIDMKPIINLASLDKSTEGYNLIISYDLNGLHSASMQFELAYDNEDVMGEVKWNMNRAHKYEKNIVVEGMKDVVEFPVFAFLDIIGIPHMSTEAVGLKDQLFLSLNYDKLYPAFQTDAKNLYFENSETTADGVLRMSGIKNAAYGKRYALINKIKLAKPDKDGNEYIWLEFHFGFKGAK